VAKFKESNYIESVVNGKVTTFFPQVIAPSAWFQHIPFLFWLFEIVMPKSYLELGVHNGVSYFSACEAVRQLKLDTKCLGIDHWLGDNQAGIFDDSVFENFKINHKQYEDISSYIKSDFESGMKEIKNDSIEIIHIDGFHTYAAVENDFNLAYQKINKQKGIILLHDINEYQITFGVNKFWQEIEKKFKVFKFNHGHGLGVVFVGSKIDKKIIEIFSLNAPDEMYLIKNIFEILGQRVEILAQNKSMKDILNNQEEQLNLKIKMLNETRDDLTNVVNSYEIALNKLQKSNSWKLTEPLRKIANVVRKLKNREVKL
jgi:hypothetical protein